MTESVRNLQAGYPSQLADYHLSSWKIAYTGESPVAGFTSKDGTWEQAPALYVHHIEVTTYRQCPVFGGSPYLDTGQTEGAPYYFLDPVVGYPIHTWEVMSHLRRSRQVKFGQWVHPDIMEWARTACVMVETEGPWMIYYVDGAVYTPAMGSWEEAPLDGVVLVAFYQAQRVKILRSCDYYFIEQGWPVTTNDLHHAVLGTCPHIKLSAPRLINWQVVHTWEGAW